MPGTPNNICRAEQDHEYTPGYHPDMIKSSINLVEIKSVRKFPGKLRPKSKSKHGPLSFFCWNNLKRGIRI